MKERPLSMPSAEAELRSIVLEHWGTGIAQLPLEPLLGPGAVSHTASLWRVGGGDRSFILKRLTPAADRGTPFRRARSEVLSHCRQRGVPVIEPCPTTSGREAATDRDGGSVELFPWIPSAQPPPRGSAAARAVMEAGLALRRALDEVDPELGRRIGACHPPRFVEEEDWRRALDDTESRILPKARRRRDEWGRLLVKSLTPMVENRSMFAPLDGPGAPRRRLVHGDLHSYHFLLGVSPVRVRVILDFDNLHLGDPMLDLAWIADTIGSVGADSQEGSIRRFLAAGFRSGLLSQDAVELLMPVLVTYLIPVVVDIAKDILDRGILKPAWNHYLNILDIGRKILVHRQLLEASTSAKSLGELTHGRL